MKTSIVRYIIMAVAIFMSACSSEKDSLPLYGAPTTITPNESAIDTVCRIQAEFIDLPKPLMASLDYQPPWTSRNLGAAPVKHRGYHKVILTSAGLDFITRHSRLELVVSLTPLFEKPGIGGEAAVLLAGIPAGDKSVQRGITARLANAIKESHYRKPTDTGDWYVKAANYYSRVNTFSGLGNTTQNIHKKRPENLNQSLEAAIIEALRAYGKAPITLFDERPYMPQPHNEERIKKWIKETSAPRLNDKANQFIHRNNRQFTALVLFPFLPEPGRSTLMRDEILMMYLLSMENKYWPAIMQLSSGKKHINKLRKEFQREVEIQIADICNS